MTKVEHERAPSRNPARQHERLPTSESEGVFQRVAADPPAVRPPPEHAGVEYHWVKTASHPNGEPMLWEIASFSWWPTFSSVPLSAAIAGRIGWRWIAPCEPPA